MEARNGTVFRRSWRMPTSSSAMCCRMCLGFRVRPCLKLYWRTSRALQKSLNYLTGAWPKIPQIIEALEGHRMSDHHRLLIRQSLRHMRYVEEMIEELDKEIAMRL